MGTGRWWKLSDAAMSVASLHHAKLSRGTGQGGSKVERETLITVLLPGACRYWRVSACTHPSPVQNVLDLHCTASSSSLSSCNFPISTHSDHRDLLQAPAGAEETLIGTFKDGTCHSGGGGGGGVSGSRESWGGSSFGKELLTPKEIGAALDKFVVGQELAKKAESLDISRDKSGEGVQNAFLKMLEGLGSRSLQEPRISNSRPWEAMPGRGFCLAGGAPAARNSLFVEFSLELGGVVAATGLELRRSDFHNHGFGGFRVLPQLHQKCGIATSAYRPLAGTEEEVPVRSPLSQAPGPLGSGGRSTRDPELKTAHAVLRLIRQSPQKLNLVAEMVRGMRVEDALAQLTVSVKRAAKIVFKVLHSAQANAVHNFGLAKDRLVVREAFVGKDRYLKRLWPHGRGRSGKMVHPKARLTVIVAEMSVEQETDVARLRVLRRQGTRMSRGQARLAPHSLLETKWTRQRPPPEAVA